MRRFQRRPAEPAAEPAAKPRFADIATLAPEGRRAAFAGPDRAAWIEAAAQHGIVEAQLLFGQLLLDRSSADGSSADLAFRWFKAAAGAGLIAAVNMVGRCHERGWGTDPDPAAALPHYVSAAEAGLDWGAFNLAGLLLYGLGTPRDRPAAHRWYERAAAAGHAKAMNMLGRFHEEGWDRPVDLRAAAGWYRRAAEAGDDRAQYNWATILAAQGHHREAVLWLREAFQSGSPAFRKEAADALMASRNPLLRAIVA